MFGVGVFEDAFGAEHFMVIFAIELDLFVLVNFAESNALCVFRGLGGVAIGRNRREGREDCVVDRQTFGGDLVD